MVRHIENCQNSSLSLLVIAQMIDSFFLVYHEEILGVLWVLLQDD